jgi:hypothetical protein
VCAPLGGEATTTLAELTAVENDIPEADTGLHI